MIDIAHHLPDHFKCRSKLPMVGIPTNQRGSAFDHQPVVIRQAFCNSSNLEDAVKRLADGEDKYLTNLKAKRIGMIEDIHIIEDPDHTFQLVEQIVALDK